MRRPPMRMENSCAAKTPETAPSRSTVIRIAESDPQSRVTVPLINRGGSSPTRTKKLFDILGLEPLMNRQELSPNSLWSIPKRAISSRLRNLIELFGTAIIAVNSVWSIPIFSRYSRISRCVDIFGVTKRAPGKGLCAGSGPRWNETDDTPDQSEDAGRIAHGTRGVEICPELLSRAFLRLA